jgi:type IV secretory pathway VirB4 component
MNPNQIVQPAGLPQQVGQTQPQTPSGVVAGMPVVEIPVSPEAQHPKSNPNSTQNALLISEVRDGIVIMNDGSFRAVVMCKSINFDLMSPEEREAVEFSYQGFLNSLYFPIQIFIRSQKVDIRPYLEKLNKIRNEQDNMLLGLLTEDYVAFLGDIAQQTNIMDKKFYLVIRYPDIDESARSTFKQSTGFFTGMLELLSPRNNPHVVIDEAVLEKAKTELRNRVQAVLQGLSQCGVQALPLDTQELIELYYDAYNPDTATRQQLKNFDELSTPIIDKGEGNAPQPNLDKELA